MVQKYFGGKALCDKINADECVAHGAAVMAAQLMNGTKGIKLKDLAPLSIGIGIKGGVVKVRACAQQVQHTCTQGRHQLTPVMILLSLAMRVSPPSSLLLSSTGDGSSDRKSVV